MLFTRRRSPLAVGTMANQAYAAAPILQGYYAAFVFDPDGNNMEAVFRER
jgi:hypothetical protein